ncbi:TadE/TadG family type IV pilus assembly protein [Sphingobium quisquiliarum]|uniref:TadE/TadG family type IV pilus assembly protein n=1 Tax=Sphingobium quisquiliarum TaxID=538379 RepID=UPI00041FB219|nr:TadE/TadG family type IV pilus assembly protein [Sphingobium quisquiliarum]
MSDRIKRTLFILMRLYHNQAGNTLMIVAAAVIPLLGLVGGAIDMSRLYLTKARLQQACDAGALAGRKQMGPGAWSADNGKANQVALQLFDANFGTDPYGTTGTTRSFAENNRKVTGTASVTVPMTVMRALGQSSKVLQTTCEAEMRIPNTDVMFVLDVTGSMASKANNNDSLTKIEGLKKAVKCFYEALAKINTSADCGSTPTGKNSSTAQIRFGFVPYSVNVNVGRLLKNDWIADNWTYQSRVYAGQDWSYWRSGSADISCSLINDTNTEQYRNKVSGNGNQKCWYEKRTYGAVYTYKPISLNVSGLKGGGNAWNSSVTLPLDADNANVSVSWDGCIEERPTVRASTYDPIPSGAKDLDIDMVPYTGDSTTQWGPLLPNAVWGRVSENGSNSYDAVTTGDLSRNISSSCPAEARKLQVWPSAANTETFEAYVNSLSPTGNTYHDIGLLWGARLASPTGIFAQENAATSTGGQIERHIVFMTDGDTQTAVTNYNAYGVPWWDRRQTSLSSAPSSNDTNAQVNARFSALCTAIKNKGFTVWTIYFGVKVTTSSSQNVKDTAARLKNCASDDHHAFTAADSATLISNFQDIADNISQLRLTQ